MNLLHFLDEKSSGAPHELLYWRFGTQWAVRRGDWKLVQAREGHGGNTQVAKVGPVRLFNLKDGMGEKKDLAAAHPEMVTELEKAWQQWNKDLPEPTWKPGATAEGSDDPP